MFKKNEIGNWKNGSIEHDQHRYNGVIFENWINKSKTETHWWLIEL